MELVTEFFEWAWPRHLNPISWYIRPLFFIPIALFAWRRQGWWMSLSIVAMLSSFFWFPEPAEVDPAAQAILDMEAELFAQPSWQTVISLGTIPIFLGGLVWAFWRHSIGIGLWVVNVGVAYKAAWVWVNTDFAGFMHVVPIYAIALLVINALTIGFAKWRKIPLYPDRNVEKQAAEA
ncbi:hypothetical protein [Glycomyces tritici]|uniref:Uncharacterized protein n=1 Tax=Glycomyces tritici TaxID=2665176 RepID=A0ABT7YRW9_9ACTN|nr:hypothetical protein [Glycomyces tritici]MDN3241392.1 hypothetical protein [Glycomyces tritici]MDN3242124.1 hypothetical protein [Glycomyces tritici]